MSETEEWRGELVRKNPLRKKVDAVADSNDPVLKLAIVLVRVGGRSSTSLIECRTKVVGF